MWNFTLLPAIIILFQLLQPCNSCYESELICPFIGSGFFITIKLTNVMLVKFNLHKRFLLVASVLRYPSPIPSNYSIFNWNFPRACSPKKGAKIFNSGQWFQCNRQSGWSHHQVYLYDLNPTICYILSPFHICQHQFFTTSSHTTTYTSNRWRS